jgi:hypothetical protein
MSHLFVLLLVFLGIVTTDFNILVLELLSLVTSLLMFDTDIPELSLYKSSYSWIFLF